ncbi:LysM peptidoglycan-binding domain-containing protein [Polaribacter sp. IC066]|uniref:LysM peptidoglycan-binding domain-containing protein n=2 Tax=unclassified Polaribacter TaxID=196858 RepID=UPI0011BFD252|nr:LysM peptidoglycan-binding domain-containing protein [Polaribacter sp. IC066]TXD51282.1 LysM peptidoglycan-binding domain-containing protein [Polaribacter sp. IC063]TXD58035.1 LysM peptidoglycan-binding domain-containing protein [Polaribacter sp. IC066]
MGIEHMKHLKFFIFLCILTFTVSCGQQIRFIQYKVQKGETFSEIAQKLDMKAHYLIRLNPGIDSSPKPNSYIVVPEKNLKIFNQKRKEKPEIVIESVVDSLNVDDNEKVLDKFVLYKVKKGDTFYNLNKTLEVTRGELLLLNPELSEGLKLGMILKIKEIPVEVVSEEIFYDDYIKFDKALKVALLLPFRADKYKSDSLTLKDIFIRNAILVNIATDFYLGAEVAVDSLRGKGVDIELNVFDTGDRKGNELRKIISEENLNSNDVVIGPLYSEELQTVAASVNIPIVFPVYSKNQSEFSSSNIVKTSPDKKVFREELERYILENFDGGNIIIVSDDALENLQTSRFMRNSLEAMSDTISKTIHILSPKEGFIEKSRFLQILKPNTKNWVVLATDNNVIVSDVVNSLISLPEETPVKVFTFDKGEVYDNIDNGKLAKIGFTYVSDDFVDESSLSSRIFRQQYLKKNKALPSFYATKGFDITYDILVRLASGNNLKSTLDEGMSMRVETKFDYRNSENIAENKGLFIVEYNKDLTLKRLK